MEWNSFIHQNSIKKLKFQWKILKSIKKSQNFTSKPSKLINFPLSSNKTHSTLPRSQNISQYYHIHINRGNKSVNESPRNSTQKPEHTKTAINPQSEIFNFSKSEFSHAAQFSRDLPCKWAASAACRSTWMTSSFSFCHSENLINFTLVISRCARARGWKLSKSKQKSITDH